ncbi:MAG: SLC13 family permease, partial [Pirellulales bacterium]
MSIEGWFTIAVVGLVLLALMLTQLAPDVILVGGLVVLLLSGILAPDEALAGLSNEGMVTVGVLFIVGAGVRETGSVDWLAQRLFGRPQGKTSVVVRLMLPVAGLSAFMNNTPLVAMLIPAVADWAKQLRVPVSRVMMPLSFAAILGGTCTLIGTSTNLVVNGMLIRAAEKQPDLPAGLSMFEITWVGLPAALVGMGFIALVGTRLIPDRRPPISRQDDPREYTVEMLVAPDSPLVGKTIEQAGLRHLEGVYLAEIDRDGTVLPAVSPQERLRHGDRLIFVGIVESVVELRKIRGLVPATDQVFKLSAPATERTLVEAVVSDTCPNVGRTIREGRFRTTYNAAVIAVARNGQRLRQKIGDIVLRAGDTLLLESHPSFAVQQRNNRDFFLVSTVEDSTPPRHERALLSLGILLGMVVVVTLGQSGWLAGTPLAGVTMLKAALAAVALMLLTRCVSVSTARRSIDWSVLLAIAASFGIGTALE